jgi:hypothetical protein
MNDDPTIIVAKAGPGVVVVLYQSIANSLPSIILWATAIYSVAQAYIALRKIYIEWKGKRASKKRRATDLEEG